VCPLVLSCIVLPVGVRTHQAAYRPSPRLWRKTNEANLQGRCHRRKSIGSSLRVVPDLEETRRLGIDYMPVVYPGFSAGNLKDDPARTNEIPRHCGRILWRQASEYVKAGATMLFGNV
jgi:hypothetical protein